MSAAAQKVDVSWRDFPTSWEAKIDKIKDWLSFCDNWHPTCTRAERLLLPLRLIDLAPGSDVSARLVSIHDIASTPPAYAALSYCWGTAQTLRTTRATVRRFLTSLPVNRVPPTISEAFTLTKQLGLRYIWVDALCIIQDDQDDWDHEAGNMHSIFAGSYLTFMATGAASAAGGLFAQQHRAFAERATYDRVFVEARTEDRQSVSIHICPVKKERSALRKRGWTLQEDVLSRRTIQISNSELIWRCRSGVFREIDSCDKMVDSLRVDGSTTKCIVNADEIWRSVLADYSGRHFSFPSDRLPALAGLVGFFQNLRRDECLLGLWRKTIPRDLMWRRIGVVAQHPLQPPPAQPLPTWSPLSCRQIIEFDAWINGTSKEQAKVWCVEVPKSGVSWVAKPWLSSLHSTSLVVRGPTRNLLLAEIVAIEGCNPPYFNVDAEILEDDICPLPWRCAVQWDVEEYRAPRLWKCLLLQKATVSGFALGGETFLILDAANEGTAPPCYRRVGIGSLGRHRHAASASTQIWKFDFDEQEEIALV